MERGVEAYHALVKGGRLDLDEIKGLTGTSTDVIVKEHRPVSQISGKYRETAEFR